MHATIKINMDNAAFANNHSGELARILRDLADKVSHSDASNFDEWSVRDYNGNTIGSLKIMKR